MEECKLPDHADFKTISGGQIKRFREDGLTIMMKELLSPAEIATYHFIIKKSALKHNTEKRKIEDRNTYGKAFFQITDPWRQDEKVKKLIVSRRLANVAADLANVENVHIYQDMPLLKETFYGLTRCQPDQYYLPVDANQITTMRMPPAKIEADIVVLTFASGSRKKGSAFSYEISDKSVSESDTYVTENNFKSSREKTMKAGDAISHTGFTIHNAPDNKSNIIHPAFSIIYITTRTHIKRPGNECQRNGLKAWLMNKERVYLPIQNVIHWYCKRE